MAKTKTKTFVLLSLVFLGALFHTFELELNKKSMETTTSTNKSNKSNEKKKRWQPRTSAYACPGQGKDTPADLFRSQFQEDRTLMKWFGNMCNGTYMEMGALDGKTWSNSYVFSKGGLGWRGFLLEASPIQFEGLKVKRPNELALVHAGVCGKEMDLHFVDSHRGPAGSGFLEFAGEKHKKIFFSPEDIANAKIVKCKPLGDLIHQHVGDYVHFDFYSLDIEGAEYGALETIDFDKVSFGIIFVEASGHNQIKDTAVRTLLESKGYRHIQYDIIPKEQSYPSDWFINKDWHTIYSDLIYQGAQ